MDDQGPQWKKRGADLRKMSLALSIPTMFIGGPLGVGFIGYWIGRYFDYPKTGFMIGFTIGFVIAIRETVRTIKKLS